MGGGGGGLGFCVPCFRIAPNCRFSTPPSRLGTAPGVASYMGSAWRFAQFRVEGLRPRVSLGPGLELGV